MENPKGLCQCGCGGETWIASYSRAKRGWVKGQAVPYIRGHSTRRRYGSNSKNWKGGRRINSLGYRLILVPGHPRSNVNGYVREHIYIAEKALGKPLPPGAVIHHVNETKADNGPGNLVICQDEAYHRLLHKRMRAIKARAS